MSDEINAAGLLQQCIESPQWAACEITQLRAAVTRAMRLHAILEELARRERESGDG